MLKKKESNAVTKIALSIEGQQGSLNLTLSSQITLQDLVSSLILEGKCDEDCLKPEASPMILYIRQSFTLSSFASTTLASLGLSGYSNKPTVYYLVNT